MHPMATKTLTLRKCPDGYYRAYWTDEIGERHGRSFGKVRVDAQNEFSRFHARWKTDPAIRTPSMARPLTVQQAWERFNSHAQAHYRRPDGSLTGEARNIADAFRPVLELFGEAQAGEMGPRMLKTARERMIEQDLCVNVINQRVRKIRQVFKWLVSEELVKAEVWHSLQTVTALQPGRPVTSLVGESLTTRTSEPVRPVAAAIVDMTLVHLPPTLQAMIRLQLLTAMRPEDVCSMRPIDIDASGAVWVYTPAHHKNTYRQHERHVLLGPQAQAIVQEYLNRDTTAYLFSPMEAIRQRHAGCKLHRHQPVLTPVTERRVGMRYTSQSYARAIADVCAANELPHWAPNQLRHTALTQIRKQYGVEVAQVVAGHRKCDVTQVYAEANREKAAAVVLRIG